MKRKWKLGCGASLEVLELPEAEEDIFVVRIMGGLGQGWFAEVKENSIYPSVTRGSDLKLIVRPKAIPKLIKVLQYLEEVKA